MRPSFLDDNTPYFFSQRTERTYQQRRPRKAPEERRDWLGADAESVASALGPKSSVRRGSAASSRRVALSGKVAILPPLDRDGPRLVSGESVSGETKQALLASLREEEEEEEKKARSGWAKVKEIYKFNELKFGSTSILSNLGKCLDSVALGEEEEEPAQVSQRLDCELARRFLQDHRSLTSDIVVEKREWQTDCYLDLSSSRNRHPFLTAPPEETEAEEGRGVGSEDRRISGVTIAGISQRYARRVNPKPITFEEVTKKGRATGKKQRTPKRVTLNQEVMSKPQSPRRPQTAHSVISNISFHSDYSRPSSADVESKFDQFDVLPAELRPPSIMLYKRESLVPRPKVREPRTRLEKYRDQSTGGRRKQTRIKIKSVKQDQEPQDSAPKPAIARRPSTAIGGNSSASGLSRRLSMPAHIAPLTIKISLADSDSLDKGWVVHAEETQDPEMATLRIWDRKSKERLRKREEEKMIARQKNADGPLVVKFYSDPQTRSLRSKHQRAATFPLPSVLSKLPPSVASFTTPGVASGDVMMIGEGPELAVLVMPDSSGHAYYHSKYGRRQAVCQSRADQETRGLYTVAYDDTETNSVLGCFSPYGQGWCYFPGPASTLHMSYDTTELRMYNEDGHITRRSQWASDKTSVSIQLNPSLSFHCTCLGSMVLRFSCRGQTYKFNVSPPAPLDGQQQSPEKKRDVGGAVLQSGLEFISNAARAHTRTASSPPPPPSKPTKTVLKKQQTQGEGVGRGRSVSLAVGEEGAEVRETDILNLDRTLAHYRDRIRNTVDEWMGHYREVIGISVPAHLRSALSRSPSSSPTGILPPAQRLHSSRSYTGEVVHSRPVSQTARYHTHPLPSRVVSPLGGQRSPREGAGGDEDGETEIPLATPIPATPTPLSTLDHGGQVAEERVRDLRRRNVRGRSSSVPGKSRGCPVALHNYLLGNLATMSPCKCDKRRPPYICDIEYDTFLTSHVPSTQVVVVCILSSIAEGSCPCEPMLDALHYRTNRRRFSPCTQSMGDSYRVVKYDLSHSLSGTSRTTPLLVERHRVWPGMFLMYVGGRLVHADSVFNGYGTTKRDFLKQVERCVQEASRGHFIPTDYHFNSHCGGKHPTSLAWAYPLSGVLGFLIPYSPSLSASRCSSGQLGDEEDHGDTPLHLSRQSATFPSVLDLSHSETLSQLT